MRRTLARADRNAHGVTLIEMLIALTMTLIVLGAVVTMFGMVGESVNDSRATIEMANRLRSATLQLREDLEGITVTMLPPRRPEQGEGYFEYIEGPNRDFTAQPTDVTLGDADDALFMTIRSTGEPFVTNVNGTAVTSTLAEVVWFVAFDPNDPEVQRGGAPTQLNLYRRALLIQPGAAGSIPSTDFGPVGSFTDDADKFLALKTLLATFHQKYDLSARIEGNGIVLNTLGDLTRRGSRYSHEFNFINADEDAVVHHFPHLIPGGTTDPLRLRPLEPTPTLDGSGTIDRTGQDIMLVNCKGFDIRLWDPTVVLRRDALLNVLNPGDPGYGQTTDTATNNPLGAYVDLGYRLNLTNAGSTPSSMFSNAGDGRSQVVGSITNPTSIYDTWSFHYEHDGVNQDGDTAVDEGTNGIDDDGANGVDDPGEYEAPPPYAVPLRGVQVKVRGFEPDSRQVREVTLAQDFLPQ